MNKTIFVSGNFNILHPGHLRILRFAKELGSKLIVGVHSDLVGEGIHIPEQMRLERLSNYEKKAFNIYDQVHQRMIGHH